ncbi:GLPGLI family protein [Balneolaceae bacterium YR4-1]|uniref:GLPGLI family protein n=1 Tax=Halalkalibaculum roseum TaxID=2709311 RepID=A0A6M1SLG1_9BACT|nr:GLPGLI family protein [Halalkalibaculum roseum]NGP75839.1 GLPGLI family protein [Halalkalibaculum roseum]
MKKNKILLTILISVAPFLSFGQVGGRVGYITILENEDFIGLESTLYFKDAESFFFVDMKSRLENKYTGDEIQLVDESSIDYQLDFTPKSPFKYQVYYNQLDKSIISQTSIFENWKTYPCVVIENSGTINWNIINEFKQIGKFNVKKATTSFRGRNYEVWFTPDIPISIGPWKFHGLPGLILEVKDEEMGVQFLFSSIEIPYDVKEKILPPNEGKHIQIEEYASYQSNFSEEFVKTLKAKLPRGIQPEISVKKLVKSIEREY